MRLVRRLRESSLLMRFGLLGLLLTVGVGFVLAHVLSTAIEHRAQQQAEWTVIGTVRLGLGEADVTALLERAVRASDPLTPLA